MIVLISPESDVKNEVSILTQLFDAGLTCYHLRKPDKDYQEHCVYLDQIDSKYHNHIVVHYFHELINIYNLKGIHFQEQKRIDHIENPSNYFKDFEMYGKTISSSFHEIQDLEDCDFEFDYHLLSPVFSSISKVGYAGRGFDVSAVDKRIIGMGGVKSDNLEKILSLGFNGVGILGGIWNSTTPIADFKKIKKYFPK